MKKLIFKIIIFNTIMTCIILIGLSSFFIIPSFKDTDITFSDIFKKDLESSKYDKFEHNIMMKADELSNITVNKIKHTLNKLFPNPSFNYSNMPTINYPYPSIDEILILTEKKAKEGAIQGLKYLKESEQHNNAIKKQILSNSNN